MAKAARRYDIYLPIRDNDGRPIPNQLITSVEERLLARFGGLTTHQRRFPLRGIWQGEKRLFLDHVVIVTVVDFRPRGSTHFVTKLKKALLQEFDQLEILITESPLRVH